MSSQHLPSLCTALFAVALGAACTQEASLGGSMRPADGGGTRSPAKDAGVGPAPMKDAALADAAAADPVLEVAADLDVDFERCSLYTGFAIGERWEDADAGVEEPVPSAECATLELPLRWSEPDGPKIDWFVKRLRAEERSRGQLWLLQGGPGSPGVNLEGIAEELHRAVRDLDIYIPDHRGVGRSTLYECKESMRVGVGSDESQLAACGEELRRDWGEDTQAFTTTAASRDVLAVATHFQRDGDELIVWGASYGGSWAHRVLQADRNHAVTSAVLDSAALPVGGLSTLYQVLKVGEAGDSLLAACALDEECARRLGSDPNARALAILDDLCPAVRALPFGQRPYLQSMLSAALRQWRLLRLIPAMLYRAKRCSGADIAALLAFADEAQRSEAEAPSEAPSSAAIYFQIMYAEIVTELSAPEEIVAASKRVVFSDVANSLDLRAALMDWPRYPEDEFMGRWAETEIPLLLLHGGLDTQTPASEGRALFEHFTRPGQQAHFFPSGGHGLYYSTHHLLDDEDVGCGAFITQQFLRDPTHAVDASCIADAEPLDFSAGEQVLTRIFGHTNVWDEPRELDIE